ncbi:glycine betaine/L-proline ABC transporter ATP-binding protein [Spirulina major CS-329]|uniref:quaternary amine ABC transporter ATP-binding protein n=1 Tax=Spirulina TaxID=1154 RepID=UPI00232F2B53|nr:MULTISPECIES: glycine betaine/L-proline ABC transporter ATP-binding protein [Spirulina]MDB9496389.1 glycine betaine/L-proline ABC transporter ATP-binding protein [Spirulina subsalsa CS-330]MDB9504708.1 glycine betaine/L-proline ABC transporter ATP-binding protein [Spirulina major CS-329]
MDASEVKIRIENLIKIYGENPQHALRLFRDGRGREDILSATGNVLGIADVSMTIQKGELFVVMGLSGSGKSTLVRCINRLIEPTSGHIYIDDEDVAHVTQNRIREVRRTKVAMVFQRFGLFPHKTVMQNVAYGLKVRGLSDTEQRKKALEVLDVVGLTQWADYLPSSLSGGMQQRVGLARALATDAEILLMDEAFSALDPLIRREMQDELLRLQAELHKTIVFISHDIQEALKIGDRVAVMKDGYIVQTGTPEDLLTNPADDYIRAFTQDVNRAQVLKIGSITRQTIPVILGQDSVKAAWEQMQQHDLRQMYVVNRNAQPVGIVQKPSLQQAMQDGCEDIGIVMNRNFPQVRATTSLEEIFHLCQHDLPIAVTNQEGKFKGVVEQSDVLASIGRLTAEASASSATAAASEPLAS